jgi:hypothetical protein
MRASDWMMTHFKLAEHAQLIIFCPVAWKKWVHENVSFRSIYNGQLCLYSVTLCIMTSQGLKLARNAGLSSHRPGQFPENLDSGHFELFNFPGRWLLRPAFLAGIKPCDVIMHKGYCSASGVQMGVLNHYMKYVCCSQSRHSELIFM